MSFAGVDVCFPLAEMCWARRNFVARKEGYTNTWLNYFPVYVRDWGSAASQSANELANNEAGAIPDQLKYVS